MASLSQEPLILDQYQSAAVSIHQPVEYLENIPPNSQHQIALVQQLPAPVNKPQSEPYVSGSYVAT